MTGWCQDLMDKGLKALQKVSVREYSERTGINERTVRRYIKSGRLPSTKQVVNNREITMVLVDDDFDYNPSGSPDTSGQPDSNMAISPDSDNSIADAELIENTVTHNLVTMDNTVFEQLINNIKALADDRAYSDAEAYKKLEREYFEIKTKLSGLEQTLQQLKEEIMQEKIKAAQFESETRIKEMKISELSKENEELKSIIENKNSFWAKVNKKL
jgi:DNA-binding transcriptional MerR regulator